MRYTVLACLFRSLRPARVLAVFSAMSSTSRCSSDRERHARGGERLNDEELTSWLGVSRTPVREAIARLESEGLVEMAANRYTRVASLSGPAHEQAAMLLAALHAWAIDHAGEATADARRPRPLPRASSLPASTRTTSTRTGDCRTLSRRSSPGSTTRSTQRPRPRCVDG